MATLFGKDRYSRPGKGVSEIDSFGRPSVGLFFRIFGRKLTSFVGLNMLLLLFSLPFLALCFVFVSGNFFGQTVMGFFGLNESSIDIPFVRFAISALCVFVPAVAFGPAYCGVNYVLRQFSREKHAYVWWDFRDMMTDQFKKGTIICLIKMIVFFVISYAFYMYINFGLPSLTSDLTSVFNWIATIAVGLLGLVVIIVLCASMYVYPILTTYDLSVKDTIKLSYIYAFMKLPQNILLLIIDALIIYLVYLRVPYAFFWVSVIFTILIVPVFVVYLNTFWVDSMMRKLDPKVEEQANNRAE